jgi:hypothetical protein
MGNKVTKDQLLKWFDLDETRIAWLFFFTDLRNPKKVVLLLKRLGIFLLLFTVLYGLGSLIPEGFDWIHYYKAGRLHPIWTPWSSYIINSIAPLGFGFVFALTVMAIGIRSFRYSHSPFPVLLALLSLPTLWVLFMGNVDGLVLVGILIMPVGIPLVLMKPQIAAFSILAKRNWIIFAVFFGILTLILWGFWPERLFLVTTAEWKAEWVQDITLFPWGILPGLILLWFSRGDEDLLMAAGSLMTPHLFPYHFIILMPALARMKWYWMLITWAISFTPFLANWFGPQAWHFGNLMSLCFWFGIYLNRGRTIKPNPAIIAVNPKQPVNVKSKSAM